MNLSKSQRLVLYPLLLAAVLVVMGVLDVPVARWVHALELPPVAKTIFRVVRMPGYFWFTVALAVVMAVCRRCRWSAAGWMLLCAALASGVTALAKLVFGRCRPFKGHEAFEWAPLAAWMKEGIGARNLSFPSGDATLAFATAAAVSVIYPRWRTPAWMWAVAVAVTRVLQGAHYPADVTAGALVAVATTDVVFLLARRSTADHPVRSAITN